MHVTTNTLHENRTGGGERDFDRFCLSSFAAYGRGRLLAVNWSPVIVFAAVCLIAMLLAGCSGKPFNVKTQVALPALATAPAAESPGLRLQAAIVRDEDLLLETFDANLILAGVLPVNLMITNRTAQPLDLRKARFAVRTADGHAYKAADAKRAFKRLIKYYEISTYSKPDYAQSQEDFASYALDINRPLAMGESRQGMLFFIVPDHVIQASGLKLMGVRLDAAQSKSAVELQLN